MTYRFKNGKYIIHKVGVYFAVTKQQLAELRRLIHNAAKAFESVAKNHHLVAIEYDPATK